MLQSPQKITSVGIFCGNRGVVVKYPNLSGIFDGGGYIDIVGGMWYLYKGIFSVPDALARVMYLGRRKYDYGRIAVLQI